MEQVSTFGQRRLRPEESARQSRPISLLEAVANVVVGYGLAVATQMFVFPMFGLQASVSQNLLIGGLFTVVSICRSYCLRRLFERARGGPRRT